MLMSERREQLVVWIAQHRFASISQLAEQFQVSEMTIRRDLDSLHQKGLIRRVHGGAEISQVAKEPLFFVRRNLHAAEKRAIARTALTYVQSGMTVAFSSGTTTWAVARALEGFRNLTFVTNSTNVADALYQGGWDNIILTGGNYRAPSDALVGAIAEHTAHGLFSDLLFLGVHALDLEAGLSTPNVAEAAVDRALIEHTDKVVVVADHSKFGIRALCQIAPLSQVHAVITDDGSDPVILDDLRARGIDVRVAPCYRQAAKRSHVLRGQRSPGP